MREYIDNLTGLYNLFYLKEYYHEFIDGKDECYLISIDFKKLKYINDNFGHEAGDKTIITFSNITKEVFVDSLVIRRSGDEFVIVTCASYSEIVNRLTTIIDKINDAHQKGILPIKFTFNSGIILCENDLKETLYKSDLTMYYAKNNNWLYANYTSDLLIKVQNDEKFVNYIDELVENNALNYVTQKIFDINGEKAIISQIYVRDSHNESIFENAKFNILKTNYRIKRIDMKNIELLLNDILPKLDDNIKYMISVYHDTILSRECNFINYLKELKGKNKIDFNNLILSINISDYNDSIYKLCEVISELKELGFAICIDNLNFSERDVVVPITSIMSFEYVNINKKSLVKAMNEKQYNTILEHIINLLLDLGVTPIFVNVENDYEVEFIRNISSQCLIRGHVYAHEEELKKNN